MNFNNFFNEYEYQPSKGWVGYKKQLQEQGMDIDFHVENGKGFVPGSSVPEPPKPQPKTRCLTFTAVEANSTIKLTAAGTPWSVRLQYSTNGYTWDDYSINTTIQLVSIGDSVMFRGENSYFNADDPDANPYYYFVMTGKISGSGDVTSLLNGVGDDMESPLPQTSFYRLFYNCSNLTKAPNLPSTTLSSSCYKEMFQGCTSLTEAPELPATALANNCYYGMFQGCTSLTTAPELPATTQALSVAYGCYNSMFKDCTQLNSVKVALSYIPWDDDNWRFPFTENWLYGVAETGTFKWNGPVPYDGTRNVSLIPSGWTVEKI